jgi:hypothetical protein
MIWPVNLANLLQRLFPEFTEPFLGYPSKKNYMILFSKKALIVFFFMGIYTLETGCKKQLNINQDPNFPTLEQGNPSLVFPAGVLATMGAVGGGLAIVGGMWSQYFTQSPLANQYTDIDSYNLPSTDQFVNSGWDILYPSALKNYQYVIDQSRASGDWNYFLLATVMKAYTAEVLADLYNEIPYSQALQGASILQPKFDSGYVVYTSILASLDSALAQNFGAETVTQPGGQDLIFGGNISNWISFANTLELKMYLRMVNAYPNIASAGIAKLYANGASFLGVDASITKFINAPGQDNPMYEQDKRSQNTPSNERASTTFVSWLVANNDPRVIYYFQTANPASVNQGDYTSDLPIYKDAPVFRNTDATGATDPVEFISLAESYFLQAEADLRYFGGSNAQNLYNEGVLTAFAETGNDGTSFIAPGGAYAWGQEMEGGQALSPLAQIIRQKWAECAFGCHGIEAFFEKNRTGFPTTSSVYSTSPSYIPGQIVFSKTSVLPAGDLPQRFVFPYTESTTNPNTPALVPTNIPVWWAQQ